MKVWIYSELVGGTPGGSEVDVFFTKEEAKSKFDEYVKDSQKDEDYYEEWTLGETSLYFDSGDYWAVVSYYGYEIKESV